MRWRRWRLAIAHGEVVTLNDVVVVPMAGLAVRHLHDEELRRDLCHRSTLLHERGHHLVRLRRSYYQLLSVVRVAENVGIDERLALVAHHVAIHLRLFIFQRHHDCHVLGHLQALRVLKREHLLHLGCLLHFISCQNRFLVDLGENLAYAFEAQRVRNHVDFVQTWVVHLDEARHFAHLRRVIDGLDVYAHTQWIVGVLAEVAVQVCNALLRAARTSPVVHELLQLLEIHEADVVDVSVNLAIENHGGRDAAIAGAGRVRWMVLTVVVDCVASLIVEGAVLAFLVGCVRLKTLFQLVLDNLVERLVLAVLYRVAVLVGAVRAPDARPMRAFLFCLHSLSAAHARAVGAARVAAVVALFAAGLHFVLGFANPAVSLLFLWLLSTTSSGVDHLRTGWRRCLLCRCLLGRSRSRHRCQLDIGVAHMQDIAILQIQALNAL